MNVRIKIFNLCEKGQTSLEYILLFTVVVTITISTFKVINKNLVDGPNSIKQKYLNQISETFGGSNGSFQGDFKHFIIRR